MVFSITTDDDPESPRFVSDLPSYVAYMCEVFSKLFPPGLCSHMGNVTKLLRLCSMIYAYYGNTAVPPICETSTIDPKDPLTILRAEKDVWTSMYRHFYPDTTLPPCADDSIDDLITCIVGLVRVIEPHIKSIVDRLRIGDSVPHVIPSLDWSLPAYSNRYPAVDLDYVDQKLLTNLLDPLGTVFHNLVKLKTDTSTIDMADIYKGKLGTRPVYIKTFFSGYKRLLYEKEVYRRIRWYMHHSPQRHMIRTHFIEPFMFLSCNDVYKGKTVTRVIVATEDTGASSLWDREPSLTRLEFTAMLLQLCVVYQLMKSMQMVHNDFHMGNIIAVPSKHPWYPELIDEASNLVYRSEVPCSYIVKVYDFDQATMKDGRNPDLDSFLCPTGGSCNDLTSQKDGFLIWNELFFFPSKRTTTTLMSICANSRPRTLQAPTTSLTSCRRTINMNSIKMVTPRTTGVPFVSSRTTSTSARRRYTQIYSPRLHWLSRL